MNSVRDWQSYAMRCAGVGLTQPERMKYEAEQMELDLFGVSANVIENYRTGMKVRREYPMEEFREGTVVGTGELHGWIYVAVRFPCSGGFTKVNMAPEDLTII